MANHATSVLDPYFLVVQPHSSVVTLPTNEEAPGSIPGSAVGFFFSGELFQYGLGVSVSFVRNLPCIVFGEGRCTLLL